MAAQPRHPYARHIRNELKREKLELSDPMLDVVSHAMAIVSCIALATKRNVMLLNVGNALSISKAFDGGDGLRKLDRVDKDLSKVLAATGQCVVSKRKTRRAAHASEILDEVMNDAADAGAEGTFMVQAMDDGQVRVQLAADANGTCPISRFFHSDDVSLAG